MVRHYLILAVAGLGLSTMGCSPPITQNTIGRDKPAFQATDIKDKRVETDPILTAQVKVVEIRQTTVQDNLMKVDVEIVNTDTNPCDFNYKFEWFDDVGMAVDSPSSSWDSQHIGAQENASLVQVAPNAKCKDFRLKMQRSQRY